MVNVLIKIGLKYQPKSDPLLLMPIKRREVFLSDHEGQVEWTAGPLGKLHFGISETCSPLQDGAKLRGVVRWRLNLAG
jgi:hypothetical protein